MTIFSRLSSMAVMVISAITRSPWVIPSGGSGPPFLSRYSRRTASPPVVFGNGQPPRDTAAAQEVIALAFTFDLDSQFAPGDPGIAEPRLFLTVKAGQDLSVQQDFAFVVPGRLFPRQSSPGPSGRRHFPGSYPSAPVSPPGSTAPPAGKWRDFPDRYPPGRPG